MSLVDVDSWFTEFKSCERLSQEIQSQIALRDRQPKLSDEYSKISATARIRLRQFTTELYQLTQKLNAYTESNSLSLDEIGRRRRQLDNLQSKLIQLESKFKSVGPSGSITASGSSLWEDNDDVPVIDMSTKSIDELRLDQSQIIQDQNRSLDTLAQSITRQKQLALTLGDEVLDQNNILDNLADTLDRTNDRITSDTSQIVRVNRQDSTWGYWLIILLLFVAIVTVSLV